MATKQVSLKNGHCVVRTCGHGDPVLFLHAGIADSRMWQPQFEQLCGQFHCLAPDLRGYGKSFLPNSPFSYLEDIDRTLDHFQVASCWLIGASFGSSLAAKYCLRYPKRVKGLVLIAPTLEGFKPSAQIKSFWHKENELLAAGDIEAATELNLRLWFDGPGRSVELVDNDLRQRVGVMQSDAFAQPEPPQAQRIDEPVRSLTQYGSITQETLLVVGEDDVPSVIAHAKELLEVLPDAELLQINGGGHMVSMERARRINQILLQTILD